MGSNSFGLLTSITGNPSLGVLSIGLLLAVALVFLILQRDPATASETAA